MSDDLLRQEEKPEIAQRKILEVIETLFNGGTIGGLTEIDVLNVEGAMRKIHKNLQIARKEILTNEDLLKVERLNLLSPVSEKSESFEYWFPPSASSVKNTERKTFDLMDQIGELDYGDSDTESYDTAMETDGFHDKVSGNLTENTKIFGKNPETVRANWKNVEHPTIIAQNTIKTEICDSGGGLEHEILPKVDFSSLDPQKSTIIALSSESHSIETKPRTSMTKRLKIMWDPSDTQPVTLKTEENESKTSFAEILTKERPYLKFKKLSRELDFSKLELTYPLGVAYDTITDMWFVVNQPLKTEGGGFKGESKIVKVNARGSNDIPKFENIEDVLIENPSAITVYEEGCQLAVLCADNSKKPSIHLIDLQNADKITTFCSHKDKFLDFSFQSRGLARTKGGHLITTDRPFNQPPRLRIFANFSQPDTYSPTKYGRPAAAGISKHSSVKTASFQLKEASIPSFIASANDTVIITDLGSKQTVLYIRLDDSDWDNIKFEILRIITMETGLSYRADQMLDSQYFLYVAGAQIDKEGNAIIADAKNHHFKLFNRTLGFVHRISTDFPVPYISSFHVNPYGEILILSTRESNKVLFACLTASNRLEPHIKSKKMIKVNRRFLLCISLFFAAFLILKYGTMQDTKPQVMVAQNSEKSLDGKSENLIEEMEEKTRQLKETSTESKCYYDNQCVLPQMLFRVRTETDNSPPFACVNDISLFDTETIGRGINAAILNGTTGDVIEKATFDVTASDEKLMMWILNAPDASLLVAASFGDVAEHVSRQSRQLFAAFGAQKIDNWRVGSAYAIIGQRGIRKGEAHETISKLLNEGKSLETVFEGCFELPIAKTRNVDLKIDGPPVHRADESKLAELGAFEADLLQNKDVEYGRKWRNCGMERACNEDDSIPVHFFSGEHKDDYPKMCIGGRMFFDKDLNSAGRGLNLAMLEPKTGKVTAVAHFDTYEDESHGLVEWLDAVPTGYIVAVVSFDEASNQLSEMARRIFYEMGSSMIDRLKFRASWYFVGQKGIGAYTPFEDLNIPQGNNWANPIQTSFCLPKSLHKWAGRKDPSSPLSSAPSSNDGRNLPKRHFCAKYDRHEEFCSASNLDSPILPRHLKDEQRSDDAIFNVPILVASGLAPDSLRLTLESLLNQEGLNTQMVLVTYDKEYSENADLASLFHVKSVSIQSNGSYNAHILLSLSNAFSIFPDASSILVIEEDVVLSSDWLHYFALIYEPFKADSRLDLALAFNSNGFSDTSGDGQTVYRIKNHLPIGSYLMKRELYEKHIRLREFCCTERGNWDLRESTSLVPALSRIDIRVDELEKENTVFQRNRTLSHQNYLINTEFETADEYSAHLNQIIQNTKKSISIPEVLSITCETWAERLDRNLQSILITYSKKSEVESIFECWKMYWTPKILRSNRVFRICLHQSIEVLIVPENLKID